MAQAIPKFIGIPLSAEERYVYYLQELVMPSKLTVRSSQHKVPRRMCSITFIKVLNTGLVYGIKIQLLHMLQAFQSCPLCHHA